MNEYSFQIYEKSKYHAGVVTHSTKAENIDEAVDNLYYQMQRFGYTKEDIRKELENAK